MAKYLRGERPDYAYLKSLFQHLRAELEVEVPKTAKKLSYVPTKEELKRYYDVVWQAKNFQDMMIVKMLLYTGVRVSELINIKLSDVDFHFCQIRINKGKGSKDRIVPFPQSFKEMLAMLTCSNHRGRKNIPIGEYERFWPNIRRKPVLSKICCLTNCDISY